MKRITAYLIVSVTLALLGLWATGQIELNTFSPGEVIESAKVNQNFQTLKNEVEANRLPQSCSGGQTIKWDGADWTCGSDDVGEGGGGGDITGVVAGDGLTGGGASGDVSLAIDLEQTQKRVSATCAAGQAIRAVNQDGSVVCETDDAGSEVGYASFYDDSSSALAITGTGQAFASTTLEVPEDGFVFVIADASVEFAHTNGQLSQAYYDVSSSSGSTGITRFATIAPNAASGSYWTPIALHEVFPVSAGPQTFYFNAAQKGTVNSSPLVYRPRITALFIPARF
ncbi:hypothetical protein BH24DEI2_BH24DEI2_17300 [soil metagenome]